MAAAEQVKMYGKENNLCELILNDPMFMITKEELDAILKPESFTGRSSEQVTEFLDEFIRPILKANKDALDEKAEINV